jgi:hypothetical protein
MSRRKLWDVVLFSNKHETEGTKQHSINKSWQPKVLLSFILTDAKDKELNLQLDRVYNSYLLNAVGV